jgi:hypothetical protein
MGLRMMSYPHPVRFFLFWERWDVPLRGPNFWRVVTTKIEKVFIINHLWQR